MFVFTRQECCSSGLFKYLIGDNSYGQVSGGQVDDFNVGKASICEYDIYLYGFDMRG